MARQTRIQENHVSLYLISANAEVKAQISKIEQIDTVTQLLKLEKNLSCTALVIDGALIPVHELNTVRKNHPDVPLFYQLYQIKNQQEMKNATTTCAAHNIHVLDEFLTPLQVKEEIEIALFYSEDQDHRRVISFFGTHSGAGVSTTVMNVADVLAKTVQERVLVLSLNAWDVADYFLPYEGKYLSDLKIELTNNLSDEKLLEAVHHYGSFYHLAGNRDIKLQRYFAVDEISKLIEVAKRNFDVILIDGGCHFDNACYAQSYKMSDLKFLVTTQEPKGYQGYWPHIFNQLIEPLGGKSSDFLLLINQFSTEYSLATEKDLAEALDMDILVTIPNESTKGPAAIAQRKLLYTMGSKDYLNTLDTVVSSIINRSSLTIRPDPMEKSKKGFLSKLFSKEATEQSVG
jgi:Flp pilus assembly CpaE family ATPase